jgi:predicted Zn-dependent protease
MSLRDLLSKAIKIPASIPSAPASTKSGKPLPLEQGLDHLRARRYEAAIVSLRAALRREPGRFAAVRGLATAYLLAGKSNSARKVLEKFSTEHPVAGEGWRLAAQLEWKLNYRPRAMEILNAGLKRLPHSQMLHRQLAVFLAADGKFDEAAGHTLEDAANRVAKTPPTHVATSERDQDWLDQIAADPVLLGAILSSNEPPTLTPESREMLRNIEWKLARLLEAQPHHADRQLLLAKLQARLDDVPAAMLSLQRALRANPNLIEAHRLIANLHGRIGQTDQAIAALQSLLRRGLSWPDIHFEIAEFERQRGCAAEARSHLYSAIRLNPRFEQAKQMLDRMAA